MSRWLTVILLAAVMAAASVGSAAAYSALSIDDGSSVVTDMSIEFTAQTTENVRGVQEAVPAASSRMIQVPAAAYIEHGGVYDPISKPQRTTTGILDIACDEVNGAILDVYIDFKDSRTLLLLSSITLTIGDGEPISLFAYTDDTSEATAPWSGIRESIHVGNGYNQSFSITATYKSSITPDPSAFAGSNIRSNVMFLLKPAPPSP
ncbi:hypothetical protein AUP07_0494 [methanogenic archaeon mixed culture ISO4-G1]|nr:hypothetical protein AUP07_0494 [methanogenic archaeon mixed culture ISO4-G1]